MKSTKSIPSLMWLSKGDLGFAALLATASAAIYACLACGGVEAGLWEETAVAAGLVPPRVMSGGLWRYIAGWAFGEFGVAATVKILCTAGIAASALSLALVYTATRRMLGILVSNASEYKVWFARIAPFFAVAAAVAVGISSPMLRMAQTLSPEGLVFLAFLVLVNLWISFLARGGHVRMVLSMIFAGGLTAATPFAIPFVVVMFVAYVLIWRGVSYDVFEPHPDLAEPAALPKWVMFVFFAAACVGMVMLDLREFRLFGGVEANAFKPDELPFRYVEAYVRTLPKASTWIGWLLGLGFSILPLVLAVELAPRLVSDERRMPFVKGLVMLAVFVIAVLQTGVFKWATLWTQVTAGSAVADGFLVLLYVACNALTIALAGGVFAFECQQTYRTADDPTPRNWLKALVPVATAVFLLGAACRTSRPVENEMQRIVDDVVAETIREAGEAKYIFTDGRLDDAIRLAVAAKGGELKPLSMMSGQTPRETTIREAAFTDGSVERELASQGVPMLLRSWYGETPGMLDEAALQVGLELWKRDRKPLPAVSGLVARTKGIDETEKEKGIAVASGIAQRIIELSSCVEASMPSRSLADAFMAAQWRIARMARLRDDTTLADSLDGSSSVIKKLLEQVEYERRRTFMQMTPMEGLQIALRRADFEEAAKFASPVLRMDARNAEANFGMAMWYIKEGRLDDAERHLRLCLEEKPDEPAVLNNLSILCRKKGRYDEAVELAEHALKMLPESPEAKQTLEDARAHAP